MPSGKFRKEPTIPGHKWCTLCGLEKPLPEFGKNKNSSDGRSSHCRPCRKEYNARPDQLAKRTATNRAYVLSSEQKARKAIRDASPEKIAKTVQYHMRRYREDPTYRMRHRVATSIRKTLSGHTKTSSTFEMVGYSPSDLVAHLESLFLDGMSWDNYGTAWHIDHLKPISAFGPDQMKECWALNNLWPLWKHLNLQKSNSEMFELPDNWQEIPDYAR